jgi:hypothetical protein
VVLDALQARGLMVATAQEMPTYLPARDPARMLVAEVLDTVRVAGEDGVLSPAVLPAVGSVDDVIAQLQQATVSALDSMSLRDLAERSANGVEPVPQAAAPAQMAEPVWIETPDGPSATPAVPQR